MAVRKIPLKERRRFGQHLPAASEHDGGHHADPTVASFLAQIREILLEDRTLHDKASIGAGLLQLTS